MLSSLAKTPDSSRRSSKKGRRRSGGPEYGWGQSLITGIKTEEEEREIRPKAGRGKTDRGNSSEKPSSSSRQSDEVTQKENERRSSISQIPQTIGVSPRPGAPNQRLKLSTTRAKAKE